MPRLGCGSVPPAFISGSGAHLALGINKKKRKSEKQGQTWSHSGVGHCRNSCR